ncbi:hypothetical protein SO694_00049134 [Aureococcus anophagefferens]|uniref:Uncharacterized protein n=1 Tax=Aureococcus anophagefferens TaxID=44056 RepID=A0ABR1G8I0_AURAN
MQPPIYACSAIQTCDDCKKTTRHDDPAVLAKLGPCGDMLLPCEHEHFASCLADYTATLEAYVGDDVELDDDERDARSAAREALGGVQCEVEAVRNESAETDGFAAAAVPARARAPCSGAPTVADDKAVDDVRGSFGVLIGRALGRV